MCTCIEGVNKDELKFIVPQLRNRVPDIRLYVENLTGCFVGAVG
jgi:hypothetical protein